MTKAPFSFTPKPLGGLLLGDYKNIIRDPAMLFVLVFSIIPLLSFAFFKQTMDTAALQAWEIASISSFIAPLILLTPAYLLGWICGFLILEERDDGPLLALDVTPMGKGGVAIYRAFVAFIASLVLALISMPVLFPLTGIALMIMLSIFTATQAAIVTFFLPAIAKNKVQGLAITKAINIFAFAPLLAFIPSPLRFFGAPIPGFWVGELSKIAASESASLVYLVSAALITHLVLLLLVYRYFSSRPE